MSHAKLLGMMLLTVTVWAQTTSTGSRVDTTHYPQVTHAEVPLYPPIARAAHISGTVEIQVVVEQGTVVEAAVRSVALDAVRGVVLNEEGKNKIGLYLSNPSVANVKTWRFEPDDRTAFIVKYVYQIAGEETPVAESPVVHMDLPTLVTVTARPVKPYCSDCGADIGGKPLP